MPLHSRIRSCLEIPVKRLGHFFSGNLFARRQGRLSPLPENADCPPLPRRSFGADTLFWSAAINRRFGRFAAFPCAATRAAPKAAAGPLLGSAACSRQKAAKRPKRRRPWVHGARAALHSDIESRRTARRRVGLQSSLILISNLRFKFHLSSLLAAAAFGAKRNSPGPNAASLTRTSSIRP